MKDKYSIGEMLAAVQIGRERLKKWLPMGFIHATRVQEGNRVRNWYTRNDIYLLGLFKLLIRSGVTRPVSADYLRLFTRQTGDTWPDFVICCGSYPEGKRFVQVVSIPSSESDQLVNLTAGVLENSGISFLPEGNVWDQIIVLNAGKIRAEIDAALAEYKRQ